MEEFNMYSNKNMPKTRLEKRHVERAKLISDRNELLNYLPKYGICAEIGVDKGEYSQSIFDRNRPARLHLIDRWGSERYGDECEKAVRDRFSNEIAENKIVINKGASVEVLSGFPDEYFDWTYIDTIHDYELTSKELEVCRRKVRKGGIIAGHDFTMGNWNTGYKYGVIEAVYEFCAKYDWEFYAITMELNSNSFALREIQAPQ